MSDLRTQLQRGWLVMGGFALAAIVFTFAPSGFSAPPQTQTPTQTPPTPQPGFAAFGTVDSNSRMIAVTGIDLTGSAILYVIDTQNPHIAVYQAQGGSSSSQGIKLVGARNITLDLQLDGFNDQSLHSFKDLQQKFREAQPVSPVQK